ncbi:T9SS type A sorting domain-containing protein, partial [Aquimarina sp. M1]
DYSANQGTSENYTINNVSPGTYTIYTAWGNGDCPDTEVGFFEIVDTCNQNTKEGPFFIQSPDSGRRLFGGGSQLLHSANGSSGDYVQWYVIDAGNQNYYLQLNGNDKYIQKSGNQLNMVANKTLATKFFTTGGNSEGFANIRAIGTDQNIRRNTSDAQNGNNSCATVNSTGSFTQWKFIAVSSVKKPSSNDQKVRFITSNPVSNQLTLRGINENDRVAIYAISGKELVNARGKSKIDVSLLIEGIYILKVNNRSEKFIKTK